MARVKQIFTNSENESFITDKPQSLSTRQLEYTGGKLLTFGGLCFVLLTLATTYLYLLIQKIKN